MGRGILRYTSTGDGMVDFNAVRDAIHAWTPEFDGFQSKPTARLDVGPVTVTVTQDVDTHPDLSWLGEFTDAPGDDTVPYPGADRETFAFVRSQHLPHNPRNWEHVDEGARAKVVAEHGSLAEADRHYAEQDARRLYDYNRGAWYMHGYVARVYLKGVKIGEGSLWGVESDAEASYTTEVARNVADEALTEAKMKVDEMRALLT